VEFYKSTTKFLWNFTTEFLRDFQYCEFSLFFSGFYTSFTRFFVEKYKMIGVKRLNFLAKIFVFIGCQKISVSETKNRWCRVILDADRTRSHQRGVTRCDMRLKNRQSPAFKVERSVVGTALRKINSRLNVRQRIRAVA